MLVRLRNHLAIAAVVTLLGCGRSSEKAVTPVARSESPRPVSKSAVSPALSPVNDSLKSGAFDDAAARLLELQASGHSFTPREAAEYRRALNEAYTKALEAAEKGDARAEAAIRMIRAANQH